ncbi:MAG: porin [Aestuariibaculum sp.]
MNLKPSLLAVFIFTVSFTSFSQEIKSSKFGKGIVNLIGQDSSWAMKVGLRMQFQANGEWANHQSPQSNFLIRRARLKFNGFAYSPRLKYKIELGLSNRDMSGANAFTDNAPRYIYDAYIKWNFYKNFELWAGQAKLPGNRERVISSGNLQLVDRSLLNRTFNIDRDLGFQLRHHFNLTNHFVVREIFSFAQGEGRNVTTGNLGGYQYTGRIELLPFGNFTDDGDYFGGDLKREYTPKLSLALSYDFNNNAVKTHGNMGNYMETDKGFHETNISTLFIDTMFKYKGFSVLAEYANRNADMPLSVNSDGTLTGDVVQVGKGFNFQTGYLLDSNIEISGRYTYVKLDKTITGKEPENQYTLGVSKFLAGHKLKVQSDLSYLDIANANGEVMFRVQFELHF